MTATASSYFRDPVRDSQSSPKFFPTCNPLGLRHCFIAIVIVACWMMSSRPVEAVQSVTLAWDRSADSSAVGYRIYAYEENSTAPTSFNVLGLTQVTLPGLKEGLRYTFKVTSYNAAGVESAPSNEAEITVPVPLQMFPGATPSALRRFQFPVAPGRWYELQASTNMQTWTTVSQTGYPKAYTWTEIQEPDPGIKKGTQLPCRFFRLRIR